MSQLNDNGNLPVMMYLHGFMSGANGAKQNQLKKQFKGRYRVIAPELTADPDDALSKINALIEKENPEIIIGTSLGGFMAIECDGRGADIVIINPCMTPQIQLSRWAGMELEYFSKRIDGVQKYCLTNEVLDKYGKYDTVVSAQSNRSYLWALCSTADELLGASHIDALSAVLSDDRLAVVDDFGHQCKNAGLNHLYDLLERVINMREYIKKSVLSREEFETFVRKRPILETPGYYRLTIWKYGQTGDEMCQEDITHRIAVGINDPIRFEPFKSRGHSGYRLVLANQWADSYQPLYADFADFEDAYNEMMSLTGGRNILAFKIEHLPFGMMTHKPFYTSAWIYDSEGNFVDKSVCSAAHYQMPGINGKYFGRTPEEIVYNPGDIVMIVQQENTVRAAHLGVIASIPADLSQGYEAYCNATEHWIREGHKPSDWLDNPDYNGSDEDEYFVQTGPYDDMMVNFTFRSPMEVLPAPEGIPEEINTEMQSWYSRYLEHSVEHEHSS